MHEITWQPGVTLAEVEKKVILKAYQFFKQNKTKTAEALGIAIRTLDGKLDQYETEKNGTGKPQTKAAATDSSQQNGNRDVAFSERIRQFHSRKAAEESTDKSARTAKHFETLSAEAGEHQKYSPHGHDTEAGLRLQSAQKAAAEHAVPVQVGAEVQNMSPGEVAIDSEAGVGGHVQQGNARSRNNRVRGR